MSETAYLEAAPQGSRLVHRYGPRVHVLSDTWALSVLARLCHPSVGTAEVHGLLHAAYRRLLEAATEQLPTAIVDQDTRMTANEPRARFTGRIVDRGAQAVVVDVVRAGMIPSHIFQLGLLELLDPAGVRVDHLFMNRRTDPATGAVTGIDFHGSKIGGAVDGATVFIPDPMGATGRSIVQVIEHYEQSGRGKAARVATCHLMVTPEYVKRVTERFPNAHIYALRLDRGLSSPDVLKTVPGERWSEERGLNAHDYIVPGAGGLGELINNSWV